MPPFNPFGNILEETELGRRGLFTSQFGQQRTPQFGFLSNLFPRFESQFLGNVAGQLQSGQQVTPFMDFLRQSFRPQQELLRAPTFQTGLGTRDLLSPTRFLFQQ